MISLQELILEFKDITWNCSLAPLNPAGEMNDEDCAHNELYYLH